MNTAEVLKLFADPELIKNLGTGDLTIGILVTMFLGMGVTFLVLVLLQLIITVMSRFMVAETVQNREIVREDSADKRTGLPLEDELSAVLISAVAALMQKPVNEIAIKNVKEIN
jgi:Na+-transporting methylmalonyl-CoA/oxaloacetate decarboxylase gamma subunit